jgi:hypothetical protein
MRFTRHRGGGVKAELEDVEAHILRQLAEEILSIVEQAAVSDDPLAALVGMPPGDVDPPDNPVLERLLPDAYRTDADAAGEFRRYTDADLRTGKRANAQLLIEAIPAEGGEVVVSRDDADAWLSCLNDMRLALGTSLGVTEETDPETLDQDDPEFHALHVYGWLGYLQESLLSCLDPRKP